MMALQWHVAATDVAFDIVPDLLQKTVGNTQVAWRLPVLEELQPTRVAQGFSVGSGEENLVQTSIWLDGGAAIDPQGELVAADKAQSQRMAAVFCAPQPRVGRPEPKRKQHVIVTGIMNEESFQQLVEAAAYVATDAKDQFSITIERAHSYEYEKKRQVLADGAHPEVRNMAVMVLDKDTGAIHSGDDFVRTLCKETGFRLFDLPASDPNSYQSLARSAWRKFLRDSGCAFTWMKIRVDDNIVGRVVFQLFTSRLPRTCANFLHLCKGDLPNQPAEDGKGPAVPLTYKGSRIFRIVKNGWIQGGDITGDKLGNGGTSIYGRHFPDESFEIPHDDIGILGMANDGEHTNASSFYITVGKSSWMNKRYVAFGRVVEGLDVIQLLHGFDTKQNQMPKQEITIDECGYIPLDG